MIEIKSEMKSNSEKLDYDNHKNTKNIKTNNYERQYLNSYLVKLTQWKSEYQFWSIDCS